MKEKIFFASDFHLGADASLSSIDREKIIVSWMDSLPNDSRLYLLGDIFDYWYEYKTTVPRGYTRLFGAFHSMQDRNIKIEIFTGNHDVWLFNYIQEEFDITVHYNPIVVNLHGKEVMMGHGDGLGPGDHKYKIIKKIFANRQAQFLFSLLHPTIALYIMKGFSQKSRSGHGEEHFTGDEEWLTQYCEEQLRKKNIDYFVFGHRHLVIDQMLSNNASRYINIGDWIHYFSYGEMIEGILSIKFYNEEHKVLP